MKNRSNKRSKKQHRPRKTKSRKMKGGYGASHFDQLSTSHYYPLNTHNNDPSAPGAVSSDRFFPKFNGGRRNRRSKKMKGGVAGLMLGSSANTNLFSNFGTIGGAMSQTNTFSGVQNVNNDNIQKSNYGTTAIV